jgi:hypothetical protein
MISDQNFDKLTKEFTFENKTFIPIIQLAALALKKNYQTVKDSVRECRISEDQIVMYITFKKQDPIRGWMSDDMYFYFDKTGDFAARPNYNPKNMIKITLCLMVWGFIDDLHMQILESGIYD